MAARILVFSDGTGNSSAKAQKTNVWRLFEAVDLTGAGQVAFYDNGVGTSSIKYLALLGGAFGWGLKRNVVSLYKFVCRNYEPGAQISGFGFSRGAFTIRVLIGLIAQEGIVNYQSEEDLDRQARAAYRSYRTKRFPSYSPLVLAARWIRKVCIEGYDRLRALTPYDSAANIQNVPVRFLGLWDTVAAYEIPINALKQAVSVAIWPMMFGDLLLGHNVQRACHALSLDDARQTFHPLLWDEQGEADLVAQGAVQPGRLTQVWFAGVHSNVGGGYPEDRLSYVSLHWMMSEASAAGIALRPDAVAKIAAEKSPFAKIYDSRAGAGTFYRFLPRRIPSRRDTAGRVIRPIVNGSAIERIADGTDSYAPVPLPDAFWVLDPLGQLAPIMGAPGVVLPGTAPPVLAAVPLLESTAQLAADAAALAQACATISVPGSAAQQIVADTVWWRRVVYLVTLLFALLLVAMPVFDFNAPDLTGAGYAEPVENIEIIGGDVIHTTINALKSVLPSVSTRWTDAFGTHPDLFAVLAAALLISLYVSRTLRLRIADRVRMAWHAAARPQYVDWCMRAAHSSRNLTALALAVGTVLLVLSGEYDLRHPQLQPSAHASVFSFTTIELAVATLVCVALLGWRTYRLRILRIAVAAGGGTLPSTFALSFARKLRSNVVLVEWYRVLADHLVPWCFVALGMYCAGAVLNRTAFDAMMETGQYCKPPVDKDKRDPAVFRTSDLCWPSGITLEKGATYRISLITLGDWFDASERADVGGFGTNTPIHFSAQLLKRYWFENWFKPVARIGEKGDDEYVLEPEIPFADHSYLNVLHHPIERHELPLLAPEAACGMRCDATPPDRMTLVTQITARTSGKLYLYVNDAVLAPPFDPQQFYRNNSGSATVRVERLYPDGRVLPMSATAAQPTAQQPLCRYTACDPTP